MTIFSRIIKGEIPSYRIAENDKFYAFLDVFPIVEGHVLVVPKIEVDEFYEVPDAYLAEILVFAKPIAAAIKKAFPCKRVGSAVIGLEVPHAHLHLVPLQQTDDLNFTRGKISLSPETLAICQQKILAAL
jgi:histidine triad (HIT) family protein